MKGKHSIQFGGEMQYYTVDIVNEYRRGGNYSFGTTATGMSLADIMLGDMTRFEQGTGEYKNNRPGIFDVRAGRLQDRPARLAEPRRPLGTCAAMA